MSTFYNLVDNSDGIVERFIKVVDNSKIVVELTSKQRTHALLDTVLISIQPTNSSDINEGEPISITMFENALKRAINHVARTSDLHNTTFISQRDYRQALKQLYNELI